jgi:hypothetical protein
MRILYVPDVELPNLNTMKHANLHSDSVHSI